MNSNTYAVKPPHPKPPPTTRFEVGTTTDYSSAQGIGSSKRKAPPSENKATTPLRKSEEDSQQELFSPRSAAAMALSSISALPPAAPPAAATNINSSPFIAQPSTTKKKKKKVFKQMVQMQTPMPMMVPPMFGMPPMFPWNPISQPMCPSPFMMGYPPLPRPVVPPSGNSCVAPPVLAAVPLIPPYEHTTNYNNMVTPTPGKKGRTATSKPKKALVGGKKSRTKMSLGMLARTFIDGHDKIPRDSPIVLDEMAKEFNVERRRIYDVVNILEAIKIVVKKGKNTYHWMGIKHLDYMFAFLQEQASTDFPVERSIFTDGESRSLFKLAQQFLECFLMGNTSLSLPSIAARIFPSLQESQPKPRLGETEAAAVLRQQRSLKTKIRRLYDIANVYMAVGIVVKNEGPVYNWSYSKDPANILRLYQEIDETVKESRNPFAALAAENPSPLKAEAPSAVPHTAQKAHLDDIHGTFPEEDAVLEPRRVSLPLVDEASQV